MDLVTMLFQSARTWPKCRMEDIDAQAAIAIAGALVVCERPSGSLLKRHHHRCCDDRQNAQGDLAANAHHADSTDCRLTRLAWDQCKVAWIRRSTAGD